jgi:nucleoside-diphosphate-sugar epimerase
MNIITGSTGLLGAHLTAHLLIKQQPVKVLFRNKNQLYRLSKVLSYYQLSINNPLIQLAEVSLFDSVELHKEINTDDIIYHCAAIVSFDARYSNEIIHTNVVITRNLVNVALQKEVKGFCHVSSVAALGKAADNLFIDESCFFNPTDKKSAYGYSKFLSENEVWRGIEEGLRAVIVNPSILLGEGLWDRGSGNFWSNSLKTKNRFYTTGSSGFVDVKDVARAMIALIEKERFNKRFILNGSNLSYFDFFSLLNRSLKLPPPKYNVSKTMIEIAWRTNVLLAKILNKPVNFSKDTARAALENNFYNGNKITEVIPFNYTPLNETIARISSMFLREREEALSNKK